uniref:Uncharacterized protein n=1 Tax=Anopheles christyi TaxID=43041 RepID=A0A182JZQ6_9DIPT
MESDDDLDHLVTDDVSEVRKMVGIVKASNGEDAASIKSESDDQEGGESLGFSAADHPLSEADVKSEPESEDDGYGDAEKDALISSYLSTLKSSMGGPLSTDESSDEYDASIKSENDEYDASIKSENDDDDVSGKSGPVTESESEQPVNESMDDMDDTKNSVKLSATERKPLSKKQKPKKGKAMKGNKSAGLEEKKPKKEPKKEPNPEQSKKKKKKKKRATVQIDKPTSAHEKELMSLVFGDTKQLVSNLAASEKKSDASQVKDPPLRQPDGKSTSKRQAVWHDSDDDDLEDSANMKRNKFTYEELPEQLTNDRRRKQFEQIVGKPKWADLDRVQEPDSDDEMLQTVGHVVKGTPSQGIPKGMIELKKLKNLNRETKTEGEITSISFHPTSMVAIITGKHGLVSIVAVDGVRNEKLHTIWLPKMRIVCSRLSPDGNEVIFGSYRKFYHVYNLINGQSDTLKIPDQDTWLMKNFRISRCGKYLASAGEFGEVHLMSAKSKEVLKTIQLRYPCQSLAFTPDSRYLLCHSNDTEVSVYSLEQGRIVNVFLDDGCVNGSCIAICPNGQFVATGSRQGIVNVYSLDETLTQKHPVPLNVFNNLTTYIDSLSFNATSELLLIASSTVKNAVKLIHLKSGSVFRNFPLHMTHLGHVTMAEFSPSGGYLALGTKESTVLLFRVKHYPNY